MAKIEIEDCPPRKPASLAQAIVVSLGLLGAMYLFIDIAVSLWGTSVSLALLWLLGAVLFAFWWALTFGGRR